MIDSWLKSVNDGKLTGCVMVDFRKALDLVDIKILLNKLKCYKCNENCLVSWFQSYLSYRTQCVSLNNIFFFSNQASVPWGVPQGSILGSLLFFIFRNDFQLLVFCGSSYQFRGWSAVCDCGISWSYSLAFSAGTPKFCCCWLICRWYYVLWLSVWRISTSYIFSTCAESASYLVSTEWHGFTYW